MTIKRKSHNGLTYLAFDLLNKYPELSHGVFTRAGGKSAAPYDSLNTSDSVGDNSLCVQKNLQAIQHALGVSAIARGKQVHDTTICEVTKGGPLVFDNCDGLITREKGIGLLLHHGDCQAALFYDPKIQIIGAAHAGWKGNVKRFYMKMVKRFVSMGSHPRNILVCISPSLGPDHAEFKNYEEEFPSSFWPYQVKENYFDLWAIAKRELLDAGIYENHIAIATICTVCSTKDYFSFRRDKTTGRNGTVIALNS